MGKKGASIHVVPSQTQPGKFVAKEAGNPKPLMRPTTQTETAKRATPMAKENKSDVVIHGRDGKIRGRDSYGPDPFPPRDLKH